MEKNEQGDLINLPVVKPATAPKQGYSDTLLQSKTLKKDDADLLSTVIGRVIEE